jgi:hypothetical protein
LNLVADLGADLGVLVADLGVVIADLGMVLVADLRTGLGFILTMFNIPLFSSS